MCWHELDQGGRRCLPNTERRVLVAQDDGYVEMAYWNGHSFEHDWPSLHPPQRIYQTVQSPAVVPRVRYWRDIPEAPTEDGEQPY
jgi:hypothetical protein